MQDFLDRGYRAYGDQLDINNIEGSFTNLDIKNENDMITTVMQLAENLVFYQGMYKAEEIQLTKHKVIERLLSLYLLE